MAMKKARAEDHVGHNQKGERRRPPLWCVILASLYLRKCSKIYRTHYAVFFSLGTVLKSPGTVAEAQTAAEKRRTDRPERRCCNEAPPTRTPTVRSIVAKLPTLRQHKRGIRLPRRSWRVFRRNRSMLG